MLQGVTANLMFTDLILNVFNGGICIMSGAFQPAVMARIFPRYIFGFLCTHCTHRHTQTHTDTHNIHSLGKKVGRFLSGTKMEAKIISVLMYDLIPKWQRNRNPAYSFSWILLPRETPLASFLDFDCSVTCNSLKLKKLSYLPT